MPTPRQLLKLAIGGLIGCAVLVLFLGFYVNLWRRSRVWSPYRPRKSGMAMDVRMVFGYNHCIIS